MLCVNNNSQIVSLYSVQAASKTAPTHSVTKTSSVDSASFSPEALKQLKISDFLKHPYLIPKDNEPAYYELLKPMEQSASSIDGLVEAVEKGDLFRYL